jgi:hypothetical protein
MGGGLIFPSRIAETKGAYPVPDLKIDRALSNPVGNRGVPVFEPERHFDRGIGNAQYHGPFLGARPPVTVDETLFGDNIYYLRFRVGDDIEDESLDPIITPQLWN